MALLLALYAVVWTIYGTVAKSSQDLHFDIGEMFAWSHEVVWSAPSHPPLGAWVMRAWFSVMPVEDWSFYLLATHRRYGGAVDRVADRRPLSQRRRNAWSAFCC